MSGKSLLTTVVGSYPQPEWLIDRQALATASVPRVRAASLWRIPSEHLEQAQDDATLVAIRDMERAGVDLISDGEIRRESYSNRFATALEGVDLDRPGQIIGASGRATPVPRVVGPIRRVRPVQVRDVQFLRAHTDRRIKATVPGPFTMAQQAQNDYYPDRESLAMDYAACLNEEVKALFAAGADVVQLDEPWLRTNPDEARAYAVAAINRALEGVIGTTALHLCFGYAAMVQGKPSRYAFLTELEPATVQQILHRGGAAEARPRRFTRVFQQNHCARRPGLKRHADRDAGEHCSQGPAGLALYPRSTTDDRPGLRHEIPAASGRLPEAASHDVGNCHRKGIPRLRRCPVASGHCLLTPGIEPLQTRGRARHRCTCPASTHAFLGSTVASTLLMKSSNSAAYTVAFME